MGFVSSKTSRTYRRRATIHVLGVLSISGLIGLATFNTLDIHILRQISLSLTCYPVAATVLDILEVLCLATTMTVTLAASPPFRNGRIALWLLSVAVATAAAGISLFSILLRRYYGHKSQSLHVTGTKVNSGIEVGIWTATFALQVCFYGVAFLCRPEQQDQRRRLPKYSEKRPPPDRPKPPPTPLRVVAPPFALPQTAAPLPPEFRSLGVDADRSSWRDSVHSIEKFVRPVNSRARLVTNRASFSRDSSASVVSDSHSIEERHSIRLSDHSDSAEALEAQLRETVAAVFPHRVNGTMLEPIPGSRPTSQSFDKVLRCPGTPDQASSALTTTPPAHTEERLHTALSTAKFDRPSTAMSSRSIRLSEMHEMSTRSSSPVSTEAHIHPLFRTDSPAPPPATSAGTSIIASPYSAAFIPIPPRNPSRARRSTSGATSPHLSRVPSFAGQPSSTRSRSLSSERSRPRTPPPIPDFVLCVQKERLAS